MAASWAEDVDSKLLTTGFLNLPGELRSEIYRNLLSTQRCKSSFDLGYAEYRFHFAILRVNKQIYNEATAIFQENMFIRISTPWPKFRDLMEDVKFQMVSEGKRVDSFANHHLAVFLDYLGHPSTKPIHTYISCREDLPALCQSLYYYNLQTPGFNQRLSLSLGIQNPHDPKARFLSQTIQQSLLMPFGILRGLDHLSIKGYKRKDVEKQLRKAMLVSDLSVRDRLEKATQLKKAGNAALQAKDYVLAVNKYHEAFEIMHISVIGIRIIIRLDCIFSITIQGGILDGQRGDLFRHQIGMQLNSNLILAYLKLEDWDMAYVWAERGISELEYHNVHQSINQEDSLVTKAEMAKIYYRSALACEPFGLWKETEKVRNIIAAKRYAPNDPAIDRLFKGVEQSQTI